MSDLTEDIKRAKQKLPLPLLLEQYSLQNLAKNDGPCPWRPGSDSKAFGIFQKGNGDWNWKDQVSGDFGDEIDFVMRMEGSGPDDARDKFFQRAGHKPGEAPSPAPPSSKPISRRIEGPAAEAPAPAPAIPYDWQKCGDALTQEKIAVIAAKRGYTVEFVSTMQSKGLIGLCHGKVAFPITNDGVIVGCHYRTSDGKWRVEPVRIKNAPFIMEDPATAKVIHVGESQWDMGALADKAEWHEGRIPDDAFIATRGAGNGKMLANIEINPDAKIILYPQNDPPRANGLYTAAEGWMKAVVDALPNHRPLICKTPYPHKDINDYMRAGPDSKEIWDWIASATAVLPEMGQHMEGSDETSPNSSISSPLPPQAVWPKDSILEDYVQFARERTESEDSIIIGSILPVVSGILARNVWIEFGTPKFPNQLIILVTKPGQRKSTTIKMASYLAHKVLKPISFVSGATSEQALFKSYLAHPDRVWIEDEGNTLLSNWSSDAAGKNVSKRMLKLYDCEGWSQNYIRQGEEEGKEEQTIEQTSTSLLVGTTFNNARFNGLEARDGLRRRVSYYVSLKNARQINWPKSFSSESGLDLIQKFSLLLTLKGAMALTPEAELLWNKIQTDNRFQNDSIEGFDHASEAHGSMLCESPSKILKRAMIFEACRAITDPSRDWHKIQADTLQLAAEHEYACLEASRLLETVGLRGEIRSKGEIILAKIQTMKTPDPDGWIRLPKSRLTASFAHNSGRKGETTPDELYRVIIPDLVKRGLARLDQKRGKLVVYAFISERDNIRGEI